MTVSIGADPEFMIYDMAVEHGIIPSIGIVPGTKANPHHFGDGTFCHEDNVAVEVGFDACENDQQFVDRLMLAKKNVQEHFLSSDQQLYIISAYEFGADQLKSAQAKKFGCDPDFDAYTGGKMPRQIPKSMTEGRFRYAGGHIHIGGDFNCPPFVAALFADIFLSLSASANGWERVGSNQTRRQYYGQPGVYREKPYGIEYRTPDNQWCYNKSSTRHMARAAMALGRFLEETSGTQLRTLLKTLPWARIRAALATPQRDSETIASLFFECRDAGINL